MQEKYTPEKHLEIFWSNVDKSAGENGCWLWTAGKHKDGYGNFRWNDSAQLTHRISYQLAYGEFDPSLNVLHSCDNPPCVNPHHLFLGTHADNMRDMVRKGRDHGHRYKSGEHHLMRKLTWEQVREIRERYSAGGISQKALAIEYGVCQGQIQRIVRNERWVVDE